MNLIASLKSPGRQVRSLGQEDRRVLRISQKVIIEMTVSVGELNNRLEIFAERISELEDMYEEFLRYGAV